MTFSRSGSSELTFRLAQPQKIQTLRINVRFQEINPQTSVTVQFNTLEPETWTGLQPGRTRTLVLEGNSLRRINTLRISGDFRYTNKATIESVTARGVTNLQRILFLLLNILGLIIVIGPILIRKYLQYNRQQELEQEFPNFLRDVVEGARAGMSLPQAIQNTSNNDYGQLTPYVQDLSAKLEWGIPFERAVREFGRKTDSDIIQRSINTIIQTYRAGGDVAGVLEAIGDNLEEIRELRAERRSQVHGEMITGYIIYFVFLGVLVVLIRYLLPSLTFSGGVGVLEGSGLSPEEIITTYRSVFRFLVIIQSIFSGLVIGRLSEGELKAGAKHVGILLGIGYTVAAVFM
ncbi:MAG: type II secretion system F family protein [Candidatus Nanohaloarchaea archaeon]|nr:type II secretion system F family protein [Candidatus Nanohaloarchaea archaeon]